MGKEGPDPLLSIDEPVRIILAKSLEKEKSDCSGTVRPSDDPSHKAVVFWRAVFYHDISITIQFLRIVGGGVVGLDSESNISSSPS